MFIISVIHTHVLQLYLCRSHTCVEVYRTQNSEICLLNPCMYLDIFDILIIGQGDICLDKNICRWHKCYFKVKYKQNCITYK